MSFLPAPRFTVPEASFFTLVRTVYGSRRKMLRSALRSIATKETVDLALAEAGLDGRLRGETLDFESLDALARVLARADREP
jgi:16S rRNA A1518/A1519 N6-dimethyltransferase RsmA/KsgA/DIM1 with predicted DNA glycosylase/AP lyase activity